MTAPNQASKPSPFAPLEAFPQPQFEAWLDLARAELGLAHGGTGGALPDPRGKLDLARDGGRASAMALPPAGQRTPLDRRWMARAELGWKIVSGWDGRGDRGLWARGELDAEVDGLWFARGALDSSALPPLDGQLLLLHGDESAAGVGGLLARGAGLVVGGPDPLARGASSAPGMDLDRLAAAWAADVARWPNRDPRARPLLLDLAPFHEAGAGPGMELGLMLSGLEGALLALERAGVRPEEALVGLVVRLAVGQDLIEEAAKLRAARALLGQTAEHLGAGPLDLRIHGVAALRSHSRRDPVVNLLRSNQSALAACLGGADWITTRPHDAVLGPPSPLARRAARNSLRVLEHEAHLGAVVDPLGGSYALEEASARLAESGLAWFHRLAERGGALAALGRGELAEEIAVQGRARIAAVRRGFSRLTGVTRSPAPWDPREGATEPGSEWTHGAIPPIREAACFEELCAKARARGGAPLVLLFGLGGQGEHGARTEFCAELFPMGGMSVREVHGPLQVEFVRGAFLKARAEGPAEPLCVCLSMADSHLGTTAADLVQALVQLGARVHVAGARGENEALLRSRGAIGFPRRGDDLVDYLEGVLALQTQEVQA